MKAHVGEIGTADDVMEAVEELELDEVHHGIASAKSQFVMNWLSKHKIQLNICPTRGPVHRVDRKLLHAKESIPTEGELIEMKAKLYKELEKVIKILNKGNFNEA